MEEKCWKTRWLGEKTFSSFIAKQFTGALLGSVITLIFGVSKLAYNAILNEPKCSISQIYED